MSNTVSNKKVLNKDIENGLVTDLSSLTEEEYRELKAEELAYMQNIVDGINASKDPAVMYRKGRAVTDMKALFETSADIFGDKVLYHQIMPGDTEYTEISYRQALDDVRSLGTALISKLGLKGEHIGVIGPNCYEWAESYNAVVGGVGVVVPLDKELTPEELKNLCLMGDISAVICCAEKYYNIFKEIKNSEAYLQVIGTGRAEHEDPVRGLWSWELLREEGRKLLSDGDTGFTAARICATDMCAIIFTSGTTGVSKGVMLSHRNLCADVLTAQAYLEVDPSDIFFSILPIHHTYECTCTMIEGMFMGASMAFCRGLKYITKDMQNVRPTFLLAVPLIYEKFYNTIQKTLRKQGKDKLVNTLFAVNNVTSKIGINVARPVARKIMAQFGGRIDMFIAGGARVDPKVLAFFRSMGIPCLQGYGLTETSPMVALNPDRWKFMKNESAGKVLQFTECRIIDEDEDGNGEICFRGPQVMMGYYKNPEATAACMEDGWFHTGDIGHLDSQNYVYITGRAKNVIIASNGKNVFPEELEEKLGRSPLIEECMVWADETSEDRMKRGIYVTLRPDMDNVREKLEEQGLAAKPDSAAQGDDGTAAGAEYEAAVRRLIEDEVDSINAQWPEWKKVKHVVIRKRDFNKTTGMKIRRFVEDNKLGE